MEARAEKSQDRLFWLFGLVMLRTNTQGAGGCRQNSGQGMEWGKVAGGRALAGKRWHTRQNADAAGNGQACSGSKDQSGKRRGGSGGHVGRCAAAPPRPCRGPLIKFGGKTGSAIEQRGLEGTEGLWPGPAEQNGTTGGHPHGVRHNAIKQNRAIRPFQSVRGLRVGIPAGRGGVGL